MVKPLCCSFNFHYYKGHSKRNSLAQKKKRGGGIKLKLQEILLTKKLKRIFGFATVKVFIKILN